MRPFLMSALAAGALVGAAGAAIAQSAVVATTDLNVRAGPGPQYPIVGFVPAGKSATLKGCLEQSRWCTVATADSDGWVYSDYLTGDFGGEAVVLSQRPADSKVAIVPPPDNDGGKTGSIAGAATGAVAGAIIAGPVGAAVGGTAGFVGGGAIGQAINPPDKVRTYVRDNRLDPVYLDGEVVVGASLPDTVVLTEVPDYEYRYVYVNGQTVLVDPGTRQIVYVVR